MNNHPFEDTVTLLVTNLPVMVDNNKHAYRLHNSWFQDILQTLIKPLIAVSFF